MLRKHLETLHKAAFVKARLGESSAGTLKVLTVHALNIPTCASDGPKNHKQK